ncbi:MAG: (Fe-S)-binding protein [Proteobacteria bacterium]|nr:(Fe-S)-binding protein [Pseudomonadota bacterium]
MRVSDTDKNQPSTNPFQKVEFAGILSCVHCGLCLDYCPTYRELGLEQDSPRGRLYLMRGLWENELKLTQEVIEPLSRCLDCRACETACPSNIQYGDLLEKTRGIIQENHPQNPKEKILRRLFLKGLLTSPFLLKIMSKVMQLYALLNIPRLITDTFLSRVLPHSIVLGQYMLPRFSGKSFKETSLKWGDLLPSYNRGRKYKVGFFSGCVMDVSELETHEASVKLLQAAGCEVVVPQNQCCCGALHVHNGDRSTATELARKNLNAFSKIDFHSIITNAAGCGTQLKEYHNLISPADSSFDKERFLFEQKIVDILEFLSMVPGFIENLSWKDSSETILYDAPCHLKHGQGVDKNPQALLNQLPGVKLIPLKESDWCCGSAGIYNLLQPDLAQSILKRKTDLIQNSLVQYPDATTLVTGNPGCLFQIRAGVQLNKIPLRVIHPVVFMFERLLNR